MTELEIRQALDSGNSLQLAAVLIKVRDENAKLLQQGARLTQSLASMTEQIGKLWAVVDAARDVLDNRSWEVIADSPTLKTLHSACAALDATK